MLTPWCHAHCGVKFFELCDQISRRNRNQIRKYFSLFIRAQMGSNHEKNEGKKSEVKFVQLSKKRVPDPNPFGSKLNLTGPDPSRSKLFMKDPDTEIKTWFRIQVSKMLSKDPDMIQFNYCRNGQVKSLMLLHMSYSAIYTVLDSLVIYLRVN